jgi:hypothetical protein
MLIKWEDFDAFLSWLLKQEIFLTGFFLREFHCNLIWNTVNLKQFPSVIVTKVWIIPHYFITNVCYLNKNLRSMGFVHPLKFFQLHKSEVIFQRSSCWAPKVHEAGMMGTKSLWVLIVAVKSSRRKHTFFTLKSAVISVTHYCILKFLFTQSRKYKWKEKHTSKKIRGKLEKQTKIKLVNVKNSPRIWNPHRRH